MKHRIISLIAVLFFSFHVKYAYSEQFVSKNVYYTKTGRPCACPLDTAKDGKQCGGRSALCRNGGYHIADCGNITVKSVSDYKKLKKQLCGIDH
jgi:hypothetical protein